MMDSREVATKISVEHDLLIEMVDAVNCSDTYRKLKIEDGNKYYMLSKQIIVMIICRNTINDELLLDALGEILK